MKNKKINLVILSTVLLFGTLVSSHKSLAADRKGNLFELGLSLGTPAGLNAIAGFWGSTSFPIVLRASGMSFGRALKGVQGDLGLAFGGRSGSFIQFFALSAVSSSASGKRWHGVGPSYGLNWGGFAFQLGLTFGGGDYPSPQAIVQIGYSYLF